MYIISVDILTVSDTILSEFLWLVPERITKLVMQLTCFLSDSLSQLQRHVNRAQLQTEDSVEGWSRS